MTTLAHLLRAYRQQRDACGKRIMSWKLSAAELRKFFADTNVDHPFPSFKDGDDLAAGPFKGIDVLTHFPAPVTL